ncbi:MAG: adenylate/guanylate cyclase domain-containing protein [Candidatus Thiodiazotropha sp.]
MNRLKVIPSLGYGLLIGIFGVLINTLTGSAWEEDIGLDLLFKLRGQRMAPQDVEIISINGKTAAQLGLGEEIPEWPRELHADLIDRLSQTGAAIIAFDIFFKKTQNTIADTRMANAINKAGNVLLVAHLQQQQLDAGEETHYLERLSLPTDILANAALDLAPFVLPKVPVKVSRFWTFCGNQQLISLPAAVLKRKVDPKNEQLRQLLITAGVEPERIDHIFQNSGQNKITPLLRNNNTLNSRLHNILKDQFKQGIGASRYQELLSLLHLYEGTSYPYLNFYGPPGSITTHPIQEILSAPPKLLKRFQGKTVFIGYAGAYQPKQKDGFYTVFSQANGLDVSGVEIAATAFANLLYRETLSPLSPGWSNLLLISYAVVITLLFRHLPATVGIVVVITLAACYLGLVYFLFRQFNLWLPWFTPLGLQTPLAMIISLVWHYCQMRSSREQLRRLFGYYLPGEVIDHLAQKDNQPISQNDSAFGVCLASDAQNYTAMAEQMEPKALQDFLNCYFEILFAPIKAHDGIISDVVGDAMLAIWPATHTDQTLPQKACIAALDITQALQNSGLEPKLFTRIGLHSGELVMSHVGAIDHFEYRAVGDMINTASRIENLNKLLGTNILASENFVSNLQGIVTRELGKFNVAGKQLPITLYEIAATTDSATTELLTLHQAFASALSDWKQGERASAQQKFAQIVNDYPNDGPSNYYLQQYRERRRSQKALA